MAALQRVAFSRSVEGDGVATSITIDFAEEIRKNNILPIIPTSIIFTQIGAPDTIVSSSLSGTQVTVNFANPLVGGALSIHLGF